MTENPGTAARSERIALRVSPELDDLLRSAARLEHKTLSAFVLDAAARQARTVVEERRRIDVSIAEFERVLDELDQPARVVAPLLQLVERVAARSTPTR